MDTINEIFDDDIKSAINSLRISLQSFKDQETANNILRQKNKSLSEELELIKNNESYSKQEEILEKISMNLKENNTILNERIANLEAELKVTVQLNRKYKNDIDKMEEKYIYEIHTINEEHSKEINRLKTEHQSKMETININSVLSTEEHTVKMNELNAQNTTKIMELKLQQADIVEEYERAIEKLRENIVEITKEYDKMKEKCYKLEEKLSTSHNITDKSVATHDDEIFANRTNRQSTKSYEPSFTIKITKQNDEANKLDGVVTKKPKKRKLFNPRSEIIFLDGDD